MAGGIGSRFWPMSTEDHPKQFLDFLGTGKSLIQMTFDRLAAFIPVDQIFIMTNSRYKDLVLEQLPQLSHNQILCEPQRKNTAPCIAYAAAKVLSSNPNGNLIICPSDHLILERERFEAAIEKAILSSENGRIATLGILPTRPDTGYGYIEFDNSTTHSALDTLSVISFREKPNVSDAQNYVESGNFYWNAGIFIWKASTIKEALLKFQPELHDLFFKNLDAYSTSEEQTYVDTCFELCTDISIDYAVMEHARNIDVILTNFTWSDLGTWGSLSTHLKKDENQNSVSEKSIHLFNASNNLVHLTPGTNAIIDGLDGYIVISSDDRLMIIRKENEQELKNYLKSIE